jgi:hypothetical protein
MGRHGHIDGISFSFPFPDLVGEPCPRVEGVRVLVNVDEKDSGIRIEIGGGSISGRIEYYVPTDGAYTA